MFRCSLICGERNVRIVEDSTAGKGVISKINTVE
jgi:hypothetical protein